MSKRDCAKLFGEHAARAYFCKSMNETTDARLLRLHPADNVLTVIATLEAGEKISIGDETVVTKIRLSIGHKIAARALSSGEKIFKYGAPIGSATHDIALGEHIHTHNMKSDYIPTFARGEGMHYEQKKIGN